jgi:biofilm PGA synthesis N-glycosyltransferase PgaC
VILTETDFAASSSQMAPTASAKTVRYVVISPVRNEAEHLEQTIRSVVEQTVRPLRWLIVNDGSTDQTPEIIERWAARHPWIVPVHRTDLDRERHSGALQESKANRGKRARAAKEIEAFYAGYEQLTDRDWEFLVKLDGDLSFDPDYFERCFEEFATDATLGIAGGAICHLVDGELEVEPSPRFHVRGATKIYRRACWEQIGGVLSAAGWDTVDEVKSNMLGWSTRTLNGLNVLHYRFTGAANGAWDNAVKNGLWSYIAGYHSLFLLGRCARQFFKKPAVLGSVGLFFGYVSGWIEGVPQIEDKSVIRYLRDQQLRRLSLRTSVWK